MEELQIHSTGILPDRIKNLTLSPDGRYLCATGLNLNYILVFDLHKHQPFAEKGEFDLQKQQLFEEKEEFDLQNEKFFEEDNFLKIQEDKIVTSVAISSNYVCVGFIDGEVKLRNIENIRLVTILNDAHDPNENGEFLDENNKPFMVNSVKISPDETKIISGFGNGFVKLFDNTKEEPFGEQYDSPILSVLFSNNGRHFYTLPEAIGLEEEEKKSRVYVKDSNDFKDKGYFIVNVHPYNVTSLGMCSSNFITAIYNKWHQDLENEDDRGEWITQAYVIDPRNHYKTHEIDPLGRGGVLTSFSSVGEYFCACYSEDGLVFFEADPQFYGYYKPKLKINQPDDEKNPDDRFFCCAFSPDGHHIFLGGKKITMILNPIKHWTPGVLVSSRVQQTIMAFFLCNTAFPKGIPINQGIPVMTHFQYYKFLSEDSKENPNPITLWD